MIDITSDRDVFYRKHLIIAVAAWTLKAERPEYGAKFYSGNDVTDTECQLVQQVASVDIPP